MEHIASALRQIVARALAEFETVPAADWEPRPGPGKWSKKEIVGHLIDSAQNNLRRFVVSQYQPNDNIIYRQDNWVSSQNYQAAPLDEVLALWRLLNLQIARTLENVPDDKRSNTCNTGKGDPELHTIEWLAEDYLVHLEHHLRQIGLAGFTKVYPPA